MLPLNDKGWFYVADMPSQCASHMVCHGGALPPPRHSYVGMRTLGRADGDY